jgi:tRNA(Ile)-lysidine synthase TilS/MesJ
MKLESIKILIGEIDYKLGRIEFFKERLEKWENKEDKEYEQSLRRLNKLVDEAANLLQIMKLEELDNFKEYEGIFKKLEKNTLSESNDESTDDDEVLDAFSKIKSGEASRMAQKE